MSGIRYSFGGDEHVFAEIDEGMSLEAFFKGMAICKELEQRRIAGVSEICPSNASYLVRFDPDVIHPDKMIGTLKEIEAQIGEAEIDLPTRIVELPVLYNDPWTNETGQRFRERRQDPNSTDIAYCGADQRLQIHRRLCRRAFGRAVVRLHGRVRRRTAVALSDRRTVKADRSAEISAAAHRHAEADHRPRRLLRGIYSVRGAGGYQMFGITPAPIYDPAQKLPYFKDFLAVFRPGDIVKFKSISREEYDRDIQAVEAGTFNLTFRSVTFSLKSFHSDPGGYSRHLVEVLYGH